MTVARNRNGLFRLVCQVLKHFLLFVVGFGLAGLLSMTFGFYDVAKFLIDLLWEPILRFGVLMLILLGFAVILESFRS